MNQCHLGKRTFFVLFLFLCSCSTNNCQWHFDQVTTHSSYYDSRRLRLPTENRHRGLEIEIVRGQSGQRMYANIFSRKFPENPTVKMTVGDDVHILSATLLEGGQRILISDADAQQVIDHLLNGTPVTISIGRYHETLSPQYFAERYKKLFA